MDGSPASVISATCLPSCKLRQEFLGAPRLVVFVKTHERLVDLVPPNSRSECRVSSAAITSTVRNVSSARIVMSARLPMGVPTRKSISSKDQVSTHDSCGTCDACVICVIKTDFATIIASEFPGRFHPCTLNLSLLLEAWVLGT